MTNKKLFVFGHLEFGDALILNGLIRTLYESHPELVVMTKCAYVHDVRRIYSDLPKLQVVGALSYEEVTRRWLPTCPNSIRLGFFGRKFELKRWDLSFYEQANVPVENRWTKFKLGFQLPSPEKKDFALCHEDGGRYFHLNRDLLPAGEKVFITPRPSIWDWIPDLLAAKELHFIDSCFLNLADLLYAQGHLRDTRLVFHRYAKNYGQTPAKWPTLRAPWEVL